MRAFNMAEKEKILTAEHVRSILSYDQETGHFHYLKATNGKVKVGQRAGSVNFIQGKYPRESISINYFMYQSHRLAWLYIYGEFPNSFLDHINNDGLDNRICNLRLATHNQNSCNQKIHSDNRTGFKGVYARPSGRWGAQIKSEGKVRHLGTFDTPEQAHEAYKAI